mmetsp:Transcript_21959/g.54325  ORF Transcript_21959/g.54325 Transcript_21959/m.54325 type:complete len:243 (-) Transcript_21959:965-1693(-)
MLCGEPLGDFEQLAPTARCTLLARLLQEAVLPLQLEGELGDLTAHALERDGVRERLVDANLICDFLRTRREAQRLRRLLRVVFARAHGGDDARARVSPQGGLQQTGELGIAIRHVFAATLRAFRQLVDDISEHQKAEVDLTRLHRPRPLSPALGKPLGAGQINKVERGLTDGALLAVLSALDGQPHDGVTAARLLVHLRRRDLLLGAAAGQQLAQLLQARHSLVEQALKYHTLLGVLFQLDS